MLTDRPLCLVSCSWDAGCTEAGGGAAASSSRRAENSRDLTSVRWTELDLLPSPLVVVVFSPPPHTKWGYNCSAVTAFHIVTGLKELICLYVYFKPIHSKLTLKVSFS